MSLPLRILIVTDSFPPLCGGSGWSTWELVRGLLARGNHVEVVKVDARSRSGIFERPYEGVRVTQFCRQSTTVPLVRNFVKNERLWTALTEYLTSRLAHGHVDIVHAQHVMSTVPAIRCRRGHRYARRCDRPRLLAGVLLVRPNLRPVRQPVVPGVLHRNDDALHPAARRRRLSGGVSDHSVHARQPQHQAPHAGAGRRRDRRQSCHRRRPEAPRAGTGRDPPLYDSQSRRHIAPRRDLRRRGAAARRSLCVVCGQTRHEQRRAIPPAGVRARSVALAAGRRR